MCSSLFSESREPIGMRWAKMTSANGWMNAMCPLSMPLAQFHFSLIRFNPIFCFLSVLLIPTLIRLNVAK